MDAKQTKRDSVEKTTGRVYDILKNHDQETRTIEAQIDAERAALEERQRQIERVHDAVLDMDAKSKIVLLTLYYPRRTYEQAAEALGVDVSTVSRQRKTAVDRLTRKLIRLYGELK